MRQGRTILTAMAAAWTLVGAAQAQAPAAPAPVETGLKATIWLREDDRREVVLDRRDGKSVLYRVPNAPSGVTAVIEPQKIPYIEFQLEIDEFAVFKAANARNWGQAAQKLLAAVSPALPFLDLRGNEAVEPSYQAGIYLQRAAESLLRSKPDDENAKKSAVQLYANTEKIFESIGKADWHKLAPAARGRVIYCRIKQGRLKEAERDLQLFPEPNAGENTLGIYWLSQAELAKAKGDVQGTLQAAITSLLYANKDIDTFPDALLLSAECYMALKDYYRARDVYYEVARLFRRTDWGELARDRLAALLKDKLTMDRESANLKHVFYGIEEDMNAKSQAFLEALAKEKGELGAEPSPKVENPEGATP